MATTAAAATETMTLVIMRMMYFLRCSRGLCTARHMIGRCHRGIRADGGPRFAKPGHGDVT